MRKYCAIAALLGAMLSSALPANAVPAYLFTVVTKADEATVRVTDPTDAKITGAIKVKPNGSNVIYVEKVAKYTVEITVCNKTTTVRDFDAKLSSTTITVAGCTSFRFLAK